MKARMAALSLTFLLATSIILSSVVAKEFKAPYEEGDEIVYDVLKADNWYLYDDDWERHYLEAGDMIRFKIKKINQTKMDVLER